MHDQPIAALYIDAILQDPNKTGVRIRRERVQQPEAQARRDRGLLGGDAARAEHCFCASGDLVEEPQLRHIDQFVDIPDEWAARQIAKVVHLPLGLEIGPGRVETQSIVGELARHQAPCGGRARVTARSASRFVRLTRRASGTSSICNAG